MIYDKICKNCGKPFKSEKQWTRLCSKDCLYDVRRKCAQKRVNTGVWAGKPKAEKDIVKIRITEPLDLYDHMCPDIGSVHDAERTQNGEQFLYIIRNIGKYGLVVRGNECEEIGGT